MTDEIRERDECLDELIRSSSGPMPNSIGNALVAEASPFFDNTEDGLTASKVSKIALGIADDEYSKQLEALEYSKAIRDELTKGCQGPKVVSAEDGDTHYDLTFCTSKLPPSGTSREPVFVTRKPKP